MYAQDTWDKFGGDTGTDADFQGEPPEGAREPDDDYDDSYKPKGKLVKESIHPLRKQYERIGGR
jgi:hypothetical protein